MGIPQVFIIKHVRIYPRKPYLGNNILVNFTLGNPSIGITKGSLSRHKKTLILCHFLPALT